jgi:hypothetical protein
VVLRARVWRGMFRLRRRFRSSSQRKDVRRGFFVVSWAPAGTEPDHMSPRMPRILAESSRAEAFSDGVLAIAITLLVLDLHPGTATGRSGQTCWRNGRPTWPTWRPSSTSAWSG